MTGCVVASMIRVALLAVLLVACGGESSNTTIVLSTGGGAGSAAMAGGSGAGVGGTDNGEAGASGAASDGGSGAGGEGPAPYDGPPLVVPGDPGQLFVRGLSGRLADFTFGVTAPYRGTRYELQMFAMQIEFADGDHLDVGFPTSDSAVDGLEETLITKLFDDPVDPVDGWDVILRPGDVLVFGVRHLVDKRNYVGVKDITAAWVEVDGERVAEWP